MAEFLAEARALEQQAQARYGELADQMETHNNREVAQLFRRLAGIEGKHVAKIDARTRGKPPPPAKPWGHAWGAVEGPETAAAAAAHYLMTPHHALSLALENERRAARFFSGLARRAPSAPMRALAAELAREEREHARLVREWLERYPPPPRDWAHDPDPATRAD